MGRINSGIVKRGHFAVKGNCLVDLSNEQATVATFTKEYSEDYQFIAAGPEFYSACFNAATSVMPSDTPGMLYIKESEVKKLWDVIGKLVSGGFKLLTIVSLIVGLNACGKQGEREIAADFMPYVTAFESAMNHKVVSSISFGDPGAGHAGICQTYAMQVVIDKEYWDSAPSEERENLIFHELGHCDFMLGHNAKQIAFPESAFGADQDEPESVMYPSVIPDWEWKEHREYYIKQLLDAAKANNSVI